MRARVSRGVGLADSPKPYEATLERAVAAHGSDNGQASRPTCNVRTGCVWELCSHGKTWPTLRVAIQVRRFHPGISQNNTIAVPGILSHPLHQSQSRVAYTRYSSHDNTELPPICTFWEDKIKLLMVKMTSWKCAKCPWKHSNTRSAVYKLNRKVQRKCKLI